MKVLVVYDSIYGNTEKIAISVFRGLKIKDAKLIKTKDAEPWLMKNIDLIIAGSPTHGGRPSAGMQKFINTLPKDSLKNIHAAAFDTGVTIVGQSSFGRFIINLFGYAAKRLASMLKKKGARIVSTETFFVLDKEGPLKEDEAARAEKWAREIAEKL